MRYFLAIILIFTFSLQVLSQTNNTDLRFHVPTKGKLASMYGWRSQKNSFGIKERKFHRGTDIAGKYGEAIYAAEDGVVTYVGTKGGYGRNIEIKHNERYSTVYCHLRKYIVSKGDTVCIGEKIGEMGNSGTTFSTIGGKGVHLHFEIRDNTKTMWNNPKGTVNPVKHLKNYAGLSKYDFVEFQYQATYLASKEIHEMPSQIVRKEISYLDKDYVYEKPKRKYIAEAKHSIYKMSSRKNVIIPVNINKTDFEIREIIYTNPKVIIEEAQNTYYAIQIAANNVKLSESDIKFLESKHKVSSIQCAPVKIKGKIWYKYTVGIFDSVEEAKTYKTKLKNNNQVYSSAICYYQDNKITKTIW